MRTEQSFTGLGPDDGAHHEDCDRPSYLSLKEI
jgi:hypothetical protein